MLYGDDFYHLYYDQVSSFRVVADEAGNVVKEVLYDSFGRILGDTNPAMRVPLGFGFGLHDRDTGWVRMGWRDYDPETGRFTALDPIGYAGGDSDLYGYCLDDPVNRADPTGLIAPLLLFGAGKLLSLGIAAVGSYFAAGAADTAGHARDENYGKEGKTAAQGVNKVAPKVGLIHAGSAVAAPAPAAVATAPEWTPAVATAAAPYMDKAAKGARTAVDLAKNKLKDAANATTGNILSKPGLVKEVADAVSSATVPGPPENSVGGYAGGWSRWTYDKVNENIRRKKTGK
ncbi:MAG: RHS repeat-associated core domain-containing protein [Desulfovibrionaceae bacterium]